MGVEQFNFENIFILSNSQTGTRRYSQRPELGFTAPPQKRPLVRKPWFAVCNSTGRAHFASPGPAANVLQAVSLIPSRRLSHECAAARSCEATVDARHWT